jgi:NADH-quinone oxidoreductase subunit C
MNPKEIYEALKAEYHDKVLSYNEVQGPPTGEAGDPSERPPDSIRAGTLVRADSFILLDAKNLPEIASYIKNNPKYYMDSLMCLSGVDYPEHFTVVYHLYSTKNNHKIVLKVNTSKNVPLIPSVYNVWPAAEPYEREAYDLFGIKFENHPNMTRILMPDDWEGHPLRKDYQYPKDYHGVIC